MIKLLKGNKNRYCISFHNSRNSRGQTQHHVLTSILLTRSSINTNNNKIYFPIDVKHAFQLLLLIIVKERKIERAIF